MDNRTVQQALKTLGHYSGPVDGIIGPQTYAACERLLESRQFDVSQWPTARQWTAAKQVILADMGHYEGKIDGYVGPSTKHAIELWQNDMRQVPSVVPPVAGKKANVWPTQANVPSFYGAVGANQVMIEVPYEMKLAWDTSSPVRRISCHAKVADSVVRVLSKVKATYGTDIPRLRLDLFGGCLNVRKMRGGSSYSMHAWGIALDFDPDRNALRMNHNMATFARDEYLPWFEAWEEEGWVSLGRERDFDWMHVQAARL